MLEKNKLIVVFLVVLSTFSAAILGSCVKYISNDLNPFMICFYRTFFGLLLILLASFFTLYREYKLNIKINTDKSLR